MVFAATPTERHPFNVLVRSMALLLEFSRRECVCLCLFWNFVFASLLVFFVKTGKVVLASGEEDRERWLKHNPDFLLFKGSNH